MFAWFRNRRRRKLLEEPFPPWWETILQRNVGHYPRLSDAEQVRLRDIARILVAEKTWEGSSGLFPTEEMKVTVAAQMALLLLGLEHDYFSRVDSVIIYPENFRTPNPEDWEDDELSDRVLSGQAVYRGPVILTWPDVLAEGRDPACGANVVVHEFAHQLDFLDFETNGTPPLGDAAAEARWAQVMSAAFGRHQHDLSAGRETFFSPDAGESEGEFFADASEAFYCVPADLRAEEPEVYDILRGYYRVDPLTWFPEST